MKSFGHFDDERKEYVIQSPQTPYPWINYLGTQAFFSLISNTAGGYSFYKDARLRRITRYRYNNVPIDMGGRYFYIKEGETVWNPGWSPVSSPLILTKHSKELSDDFHGSKNILLSTFNSFFSFVLSFFIKHLAL